MWIFTQWGFFSVTQTRDNKDLIQIRARKRSHLENLKSQFPILERSKVVKTPDADYRFRVICRRWRWEKLSAEMSAKIDYHNFKGKVMTAGFARDMIDELHRIWDIMFAFQRKSNPEDPMKGEPVLFKDARDRDGLFDDSDEPGVAPASGQTKKAKRGE